MRRFSSGIFLALSTLLLVSIGSAQQTPTTAVPNLIRYGGTLKDTQGTVLSSATIGVTFAIYEQQEGGAPIWTETQNVTADASGNYSVLLGSTTATGLPGDLFSQQEQRWLGLQVQGEAEQSRVLLVSVPYAFKAKEAETLGGMPASAFALASTANGATGSGTNAGSSGAMQAASQVNLDMAGSGTPGYIPLWLSGDSLGNSVLFQSGANVGIGTTTPVAKLSVNGDVNALRTYQIGGNNALSTVDTSTFVGVYAGHNNTGAYNSFSGYAAGDSNTSGYGNTFYGFQTGYSNTTGNGNTFYGNEAGYSNTTGSSDVYIANFGPGSGTESNTIRIGTPGKGYRQQNAAYMAGIYGNSPSNALPVVVNANGQLGTGPLGGVTSWNGRTGAVVPQSGDYSFSLLSGTLQASQLSGAYGSALTLSNTSNVYYGNGSNLTGVVCGGGGTCSANSFNSATTYQIGSNSVLSIGSPPYNNVFVGVGAGVHNISGQGVYNMFSGYEAGYNNT
ncbi:MAG: hypothetical protein WBX22_29205, partial [Silvibacterium sp.]